MPNTLGAVLAGGASRRFGSPKCLARLAGSSLLERVLAAQRLAVPASCIVTNEPALYHSYGTEIVSDQITGRGPAAGIHAALLWARERAADGIWCSPCDAPFVDARLGRLLIERSRGADAVLPRSAGPLGYEPLFGWYSVGAAELFAEHLERGVSAMHEVIGSLGAVRYVEAAELQDRVHGADIFTNINTREDLVVAERKVIS